MARMIINGVPHPPQDCTWCAVCLGMAKGALFEDPKVQERAQAGIEDERHDVFTIAMDSRELVKVLEVAISWGTNPHFGQAVVPLCFLHFTAIGSAGPPAAAAPAVPPLFRGGM